MSNLKYDCELVGKIGSMALINKDYQDINYNLIARIGRELTPSMVWVTSGAVEIGRIDYLKRNGEELIGDKELIKSDYAAQGQSILMQTYRTFVDSKYSLRQILVEHTHFNDEKKAAALREMLLRCPNQKAIPIINYNDAVCDEENRRFEIQALKNKRSHIVECVDNDETASQVSVLVKAKRLLILTSVDGIYENPADPASLIQEISGKDTDELLQNVENCRKFCNGSSRASSNGAISKLTYVVEPLMLGTEVIIANAKYRINDILSGKVRRTVIHTR